MRRGSGGHMMEEDTIILTNDVIPIPRGLNQIESNFINIVTRKPSLIQQFQFHFFSRQLFHIGNTQKNIEKGQKNILMVCAFCIIVHMYKTVNVINLRLR